MSDQTSHKASSDACRTVGTPDGRSAKPAPNGAAVAWLIPEGSEAELSLLRSELDACRAELERRRERIEELEAMVRSWQFEQMELPVRPGLAEDIGRMVVVAMEAWHSGQVHGTHAIAGLITAGDLGGPYEIHLHELRRG